MGFEAAVVADISFQNEDGSGEPSEKSLKTQTQTESIRFV